MLKNLPTKWEDHKILHYCQFSTSLAFISKDHLHFMYKCVIYVQLFYTHEKSAFQFYFTKNKMNSRATTVDGMYYLLRWYFPLTENLTQPQVLFNTY